MTRTEIERLAVLEADVSTIKGDVADIKADVKSLLAANAVSSAFANAAKYLLPAAAVGISLAAYLKG